MPSRVPPEALIVGRNIRRLRLARGLTQKKMGGVIGVSFQQLQKYETGANRFPVEKLYLLKNRFDVPYEFFFENLAPVDGGVYAAAPPTPQRIYKKLQKADNPVLLGQIEKIVTILLS